MVEFDPAVEVTGPDGPVLFLDLFQGRDELVVYKHMWWDGAPHQGQCEGCTTTAWVLKDAVYLNARGVSFAILTTGRWAEVAPYVEFMGYTPPWYSVRGLAEPVGGDMGYITCFLRDGDRAFLTYSTTGRGNEPVTGAFSLLDMTPYGRGEAWQDNPEGWPEGHGPCWYWRSDSGGNATGARPAAVCRNGPAPARPPCRPSADAATTTDAPSPAAQANVAGSDPAPGSRPPPCRGRSSHHPMASARSARTASATSPRRPGADTVVRIGAALGGSRTLRWARPESGRCDCNSI
jgi:predicted dithiol-disulfide oxidoreductase (DUF899 family)